ncbi:MAG TPA: hypothetical protein VD993_15655 [Chitinophagaceae bacterium]|nr:hypothetical protein [Chitinophagaceae bacterium]
MSHCKNIIHPFQNDPGISQRQRLMPELDMDAPKIDGRTLADLLEYFTRLARQINYYDKDLVISDWQVFFSKSIPFNLASISKYNTAATEEKLDLYRAVFNKRPGKNTLQLLVHFMYYSTIYRINSWHEVVKGSGLQFEAILRNLVQDRLLEPLTNFIALTNAAGREHCIKGIDFTILAKKDSIWNLRPEDVLVVDRSLRPRRGRRRRLLGFLDAFAAIWPSFIEGVKLLSSLADDSIEDSLFVQSDELKQQHAPHIALMVAFLKLFQHLQSDLNGFTRKHLDFFFKDVLRLVARPAVPDQAHIVFEIQKQLDSYLVKQGVQVKDAKDKNNQEIVFALDNEIVVNKAQVEEVKTLFLNHQLAHDNDLLTFIDGVYMAPVATKADGIDKDFAESDPKNWPTLGAQYSRFTDVGNTTPELYPYARIGFILASPVLLLNEGERTVTVKLLCNVKATSTCGGTPLILDPNFFAQLVAAMGETYIIVTKDLIALAEKKGVQKNTVEELTELLEEIKKVGEQCCPGETILRKDSVQMTVDEWDNDFFDNIRNNRPAEVAILEEIFRKHRVFNIAFSGKSSWIEPSSIETLSIAAAPGNNFLITIEVKLLADKPAVTYFNAEALKEELQTQLPVVKIELDNELRLAYDPDANARRCCFENCPTDEMQYISLYQLFRDLNVIKGADETRIDVEVCGVKNVLVRNEENLLDVNSPMAAFGVRPKLGASFYLGSKEIFSKDWREIYINTEWKDRPVDFAAHYEHYSYGPFEDGSFQITNDSFKMRASVLENGNWLVNGQKNIFQSPSEARAAFCNHTPPAWNQNVYRYIRGDFPGSAYQQLPVDITDLAPLNVNSRYGFLRLTVEGVGFQHDRYPFVLARHMMALADLVDPVSMNEAIQHLITAENLTAAALARVNDMIPRVLDIQNRINNVIDKLTHDEFGPFDPLQDGVFFLIAEMNTAINNAIAEIGVPNLPAALGHLANAAFLGGQILGRLGGPGFPNTIIDDSANIQAEIASVLVSLANDADGDPHTADLVAGGLHELVTTLMDRIVDIKDLLQVNDALKNGLPLEAYTPMAKDLTVDYTARALITDIDLIHLYPYENTHKDVQIDLQPPLFPTHCDEGTLFIGLKELKPGSNVSILFQLAEATANSEASGADISWHYLVNNEWVSLREGFEVLEDATNGLTTSGIVKLSIPGNITIDNTILSKTLHWIKVSAARNVIAVSETIGIHTQAVKATFVNTGAHDQLRLDAALEANKLSKLLEADANVKKTAQPYESFGGRVPEAEGNFYVRVSEWLHHKGRAIQKFDYERLVLDAFPEIYKVKCINHDFKLNALLYRTDVNAAPGYVMVAVIPDLNKLKSGRSFEPKAPVSTLENITAYLKKRSSPFARIKVVNPRYEKIDLCLTVQLLKGKDKVFYKKKLEEDLRLFLAPWAVGEFEKLSFGQCVNRSDIVRFIEGRDYVDYIICMRMNFEKDCENGKVPEVVQVCPLTPRSILVGGFIDVCIPDEDCESWNDDVTQCSKEFEVVDLCKPVVTPIN